MAERTLWQLHGRYLLSPVRSGLLVVDQRAAHERILYERALASMESGMAPTQQLLFPFTVDLSPTDRALFAEVLPDLRALGFEVGAPGEAGPVLVRGVPADVTLGDERDVLDDLLAPVPPEQPGPPAPGPREPRAEHGRPERDSASATSSARRPPGCSWTSSSPATTRSPTPPAGRP